MRPALPFAAILVALYFPASVQPKQRFGQIVGTLAINTEFSPYEKAPTTADQYPKSFRRGSAQLYVPAEIVQVAMESVKGQRFSVAPVRQQQDVLSAAIVNRLFLRGAVVIDKVRSKYRNSVKRSAELDAVFEPDEPFTTNKIVERERIDRFLQTIYPAIDATSEEKAKAMPVVSMTADLWPVAEEVRDESEQYQEVFRIFRFLMLRRLDPVFDLKLRNTGNRAVSVTRAAFQVSASERMNDYNVTGLLPVPDTAGATIQPGQEVTFRIVLQSKAAYLYYGSIILWNAEKEVYRTPPFSIAFLS